MFRLLYIAHIAALARLRACSAMETPSACIHCGFRGPVAQPDRAAVNRHRITSRARIASRYSCSSMASVPASTSTAGRNVAKPSLLSVAVKRGRVFPSLDTISRIAMVSKRTVSHAIAWLGLYGFLDKLRRIVRTSGLLGPRVRQTSNAYVLCFPKGLGGLAVAAFKISPERNNCPPSESNSEVKKGFQGSGSDLGLTAALGRLKFSVGRRSEA